MDRPKSINRDNSRRFYMSNAEYPEHMRRASFKSKDIRIKEKHSEFKKPWFAEQSFPEMEYWFDPPPGFDPWLFDDPISSIDIPDTRLEPDESLTVFHCSPFGCYKDNDTTCFPANCSYPISSVQLAGAYPGFSVSKSGYNICVTAPEDASPAIEINIYMVATGADGKKIIGSHGSILLAKCNVCEDVDCDEFINNEGVTPSTIAQNSSQTIGVTGGHGPYTWVLTQPDGAGFSIDNVTTATNTLYTTVDACGTADIEVTDTCGCVTNFSVRCTVGGWSLEGAGAASCAGCKGPPYCDDSRGSGWINIGSIPYKNCYPTNCKYYFYEALRLTLSTSDYGATLGECEGKRVDADCTGVLCTFFGDGGMYCNECIGHPSTIGVCQHLEGGPVPMYNQSSNRALYLPTECIYTGVRYAYCHWCYQSYLLRRFKWEC